MSRHKVVFVQSQFGSTYKEKTVHKPTGEKGKLFGLFSYDETVAKKERVATGPSDCAIDGVTLAYDLQLALSQLEEEGYEVVSIAPVTSGAHQHELKEIRSKGITGGVESGYGYAYGFSYTEGVLVTARKVETAPA